MTTISPGAQPISVAAFCKTVGVGRQRVYQLINAGRIRTTEVSGKTMIPADVVASLTNADGSWNPPHKDPRSSALFDGRPVSVRTANCMQNEGISNLEELRAYVDERGLRALLGVPNFGKKSLHEVAELLCLSEGDAGGPKTYSVDFSISDTMVFAGIRAMAKHRAENTYAGHAKLMREIFTAMLRAKVGRP